MTRTDMDNLIVEAVMRIREVKTVKALDTVQTEQDGAILMIEQRHIDAAEKRIESEAKNLDIKL